MLRIIFVLLIAGYISFLSAEDNLAENSYLEKMVLSINEKQFHDIQAHVEKCKKNVQGFAEDNKDVMQALDLFLVKLQEVYLIGEGMIEKDVLNIVESISFAAEKHKEQKRKNPKQVPYIVHPLKVACYLLDLGGVRNPDVIIAAILHDTVEDTETTPEEIEKAFGMQVRVYVGEVTDDKALLKAERKRMQIINAPHKSAGAAQIKLADKLSNLEDLLNTTPIGWDRERVDTYFHWAKDVVRSLPWVNGRLYQKVFEVITQYWNQREEEPHRDIPPMPPIGSKTDVEGQY